MDYRRMGNLELNLENATSSHHLKDMWERPRWTVIRIQALALVSIILSFFLAIFGSCRRWTSGWILQKGFFAAQVLSLSLGTYSIGLMQSSSVKSEMYPVWTVSLFTLFGCIDPVTAYIGRDYKGPLSKVVYGICLNCGYVLVMSISTISSAVGNTAIAVLSAITFIKGFHRSFALMQQRRIQSMVQNLETGKHWSDHKAETYEYDFIVDICNDHKRGTYGTLTLVAIEEVLGNHKGVDHRELRSCYDVCIAYALSHQLQRYFLRVRDDVPDPEILKRIIMECGGYKWFLEVIEIELAFMYDVFFTGNPFLYYYQAKTASFWALASFMGICFVGVAAAVPGTMSSPGSTKVVDTTTADLAITFGILVSLALLQLLHLIQCWTSNWAKVAIACACASQSRIRDPGCWWTWWMRLKTFVATSTNWFDKYIWQDKIGQYSLVPDVRKVSYRPCCFRSRYGIAPGKLYRGCARLSTMLGLDYIWEIFWDLLGSDTSKATTVGLEDDVKTFFIEFLGQIKSDRLEGSWLSFSNYPSIKEFLPYCNDPKDERELRGHIYTSCVTMWYTATRYCELVEEKTWKRAGAGEQNVKRGVAIALSKYCAYLMVSAPELLPGLAWDTNRLVDNLRMGFNVFSAWEKFGEEDAFRYGEPPKEFDKGVHVARLLLGVPTDLSRFEIPVLDDVARRSDPWETLAQVWVRLLVYAAPYGDAEVHKHRLAQGGEFVTHLWALLYHLGIREWKRPEKLHHVTTIDQAEKILTEDEQVVVAFLDSLSGDYHDELVAAASRTEDGVTFYMTLGPEIAKRFDINAAAKCPALVLFNKRDENKFILYDGEFRADDIARFVSNKFGFAEQVRAQSSEAGGQTEDRIIEEEITHRGPE